MTRSSKPQSRARSDAAARKTVKPAGPGQDAIVASLADPVTTQTRPNPAIQGESLLFDPDWYRIQYPDVAAAGVDPIRHYFDDGAREGRDPNPFFSTSAYVARYADVAASRMNPFLHYLLYGAREGRSPRG